MMAYGDPIYLANSLRARGTSDFLFIGITKTKPLPEIKSWKQVFPLEDFPALDVSKKVSMKKNCLICLYWSIQSLVEQFLNKVGSSELLHLWIVIPMVLFAESKSILQTLLNCSADIPLGDSA